MRKLIQIVVVITIVLFGLSNSSVFASSLFSDELNQKTSNSVVLYIGSSKAFVNSDESLVDSTNESVYPYIMEGRTFVPVRFISENLGAKVDWNDLLKEVTVSLNDKTVKLVIDSNRITINDVEKQIDVPTQIVSERTFIPLRALVEALGKKVFWDDRGLILISDNENIFDTTTDMVLIDELNKQFEEILPQIKTYNKLLTDFKIYDYSPKTNSILYSKPDNGNSYVGGYSGYGKELLMMDLNDLSSKKVSDTNVINQDNFSFLDASFSPNGSKISMESTYGYFVEDEECSTNVYLIDNNDEFNKKLIGDREESSIIWNADDKYAVLNVGRPSNLYRVIDMNGNIVREIEAKDVIRSNDNIFYLTVDNNLNVYKLNSNTLDKLIAHGITQFSISTDGKKLACVTETKNKEGTISVYQLNDDLSLKGILSNININGIIDLKWSPNSRYLFVQEYFGYTDVNYVLVDTLNHSKISKQLLIGEYTWLHNSNYLISDNKKIVSAKNLEVYNFDIPFKDPNKSAYGGKLIWMQDNKYILCDSFEDNYIIEIE